MTDDEIRRLEREIAEAGRRITAELRVSMQAFLDRIPAHIQATREVDELERLWNRPGCD